MKKIILIALILLSTKVLCDNPWDTAHRVITFGDTVTAQFKPNFLPQYFMVGIKDTGSTATILANINTIDSVIILGISRTNDTVLCPLRSAISGAEVPYATYDYAVLPSDWTKLPYQYFWVNLPFGIKSIWAIRTNKLNISGRTTWLIFEALRKIY